MVQLIDFLYRPDDMYCHIDWRYVDVIDAID